MAYVDGYVIPVPTEQKAAYIKIAKEAAVIFKDHGATSVVENWGDDVPAGTITSFPMAVKCSDEETVVFAWISWPSKAVRDKGMKAAMANPRMKNKDPNSVPFDSRRMIFAGFTTIVE